MSERAVILSLRCRSSSAISVAVTCCAVLGALPACSKPQASGGTTTAAAPAKKKRILILGGTGFLGPKTVAVAVERGHEVTIFNRGRREKILPLEVKVEHLYGNRDPN